MTTLIDVTTPGGNIVTLNAEKIAYFYKNDDHTTIWQTGDDVPHRCTETPDQIKKLIWDMESTMGDISTYLSGMDISISEIRDYMVGGNNG